MPAPQDPRWDWVETSSYDSPDTWIKGRCNHLTPEPVISVWPDEELVAWLCVDCNAQLPANYRPDPRAPHYEGLGGTELRPTDFAGRYANRLRGER